MKVRKSRRPSKRSARWTRSIAALSAAALILSGCAGGSDDAATGGGGFDDDRVEKPGVFEDGSSMKAIQDRQKLLVGLPLGLPPFSYEDPNTGSIQGFDIEIARLMANGIFGAQIEGKVEFIPLDARDRELALAQNKVDIALGRYTISVARKRFVDFAGPYFNAYQTVIANQQTLATDGQQVQNISQLNGLKVCTVRGSTNTEAIETAIPQADLSVEMASVQECGAQMAAGKVSAIAAEHIDLLPISGGTNSNLVTLTTGSSVGVEPYGIGVSKQKLDLRRFLNDRLDKIEGDQRWKDAYDKAILNGQTNGGATDSPPGVERY